MKIYQCLADICNKDLTEIQSLKVNTNLNDIGLDSLRFIRFIVAVEEAFGIEINDSDIMSYKFQTIDDIFKTLSKYLIKNSIIPKVLVLDCDNVLWKGTVGETKIVIDKDVQDFQNLIVDLYHRGVLICLCSKNTFKAINTVFQNHKMLLKFDYIVTSRFDCLNKAESITDISRELNLNIGDFLFIDDNDFEISYVSSCLPHISSLKVNYDNDNFISQICDIFSNTISSNHTNRTQMYKEQKEREKIKNEFVDIDEYNKFINTELICEFASREQLPRLTELSQRTHQFNLSNYHYSIEQLNRRFEDINYRIVYLSASDKFGDMGIVGMAVVNRNIIESFMISCRVIGRNFEKLLLNKIKSITDTETLRGVYTYTDMNKKYAGFYEENQVRLWKR